MWNQIDFNKKLREKTEKRRNGVHVHLSKIAGSSPTDGNN